MKTILKEEGYPLALRETYFAYIKGSIGSHQYRKLFVNKEGELLDVIDDGDLACAHYVSSILTLCGLMKGGVHTTVKETIIDLKRSGWKKIDFLLPGSVLVWAPKHCTDGKEHAHIGFCLPNGNAVSNSSSAGTPVEHDVYFRTIRKVQNIETFYKEPMRLLSAIYMHPKLR